MLSKFIKVGLAVLFFLCLLDMPYGFYQLGLFLILVLWKKKESKKEETSDSHNEEN